MVSVSIRLPLADIDENTLLPNVAAHITKINENMVISSPHMLSIPGVES